MIVTDLTKVSDVLRLAEELCGSIDAGAEDIGGTRSPMDIIKDIGPIVAQARKQFADDAMLSPVSDRWIAAVNTDALIGLVMKLTGGSANPAVVRGQIANARERSKGTAE